jgi:hypothetical protein
LGIKKVTNENQIIIENYGGLPLPISLKVTYSDGSVEQIYENTSIWSTGDVAIIINANTEKEIREIELGENTIPDINHLNNVFKDEATK